MGAPFSRGFSLVELSIVLVILGLLTGGILAGQSLIRAAELRSVVVEYQRYSTAANTFRDRYMAIPGDFRNATRVWGHAGVGANCINLTGATVITPGTCDGNGDGIMNSPSNASEAGETFQAWKQLALAGLIEGTYTGVAGATYRAHTILGTNAPASKYTKAGWSFDNKNDPVGGSQWFAGDFGNVLMFGAVIYNSAGYYSDTIAGVAPAENIWGIDTKLDDGKPAYGKIISTGTFTSTSSLDPCHIPNSGAASATNYDMSYNVSSKLALCGMMFRNSY